MYSHVDIPEVRSCLEQLSTESDSAAVMTKVSLLQFYKKNLTSNPSLEADGKLKGRLIESGVLFAGPMYQASTLTKSQRLRKLAMAGFTTDKLLFLNPTQTEMFFSYVKETGMVTE
jgi:hypothetical protein